MKSLLKNVFVLIVLFVAHSLNAQIIEVKQPANHMEEVKEVESTRKAKSIQKIKKKRKTRNTRSVAPKKIFMTMSANGHKGRLVLYVDGQQVSGSFMDNPVMGYISGKHIIFYRESMAHQLYSGYFNSGYTELAGTFSHKGEGAFPFYAKK